MPLIRYFGFVGTGLALLLIGLGWCFPQPAEVPLASVSDGPKIRIASAEQLPERVVIDTGLPTIVPPPSMLEFAERWPQQTVAARAPVSKPVATTSVSEVSKTQNLAKREPVKKAAVQRAAPKAIIVSARNDKVPALPADNRLSLLDIVKDRLRQTQAKLMASLEPLLCCRSSPANAPHEQR